MLEDVSTCMSTRSTDTQHWERQHEDNHSRPFDARPFDKHGFDTCAWHASPPHDNGHDYTQRLPLQVSIAPPSPTGAPMHPPHLLTFYSFVMYIPSVLLVSFLLVLALPILFVLLVPAFLLYPLSNSAFVDIYLICVNVRFLDLAPVVYGACFYF